MTLPKPTAGTFREPLLKAMGETTSLTADTPVAMADVLTRVYTSSGYEEDSFGTNTGGHPNVRIWVTQAFNRLLKKKGLATSPKRGQWALTPEGVQAAALLLPGMVFTPAAPDEDAPDEDVVDTTAMIAISDGGGGLSWTIGDQKNTYNPDPYIQGLAMEATPCSGFFSARSNLCKSCSLSGACKGQMLSRLSNIAAKLRDEDEKARLAALKPATPAPPPPDDDDDDDDKDLDIDDILSLITGDPKDDVPEHTVMDSVPASAVCSECRQKIDAGSKGIWIKSKGVLHPKCFDLKYK